MSKDKQFIISEFKKLVDKLGYVPTTIEFEKIFSHISIRTLIKQYYSYQNFIKECGLKYSKTKNGKYTKEHLISELQRFVSEFNRIPLQTDFENLKGYPSRKTFSNNFGTFNIALKESGFEPLTLSRPEFSAKYNNKEYFKELIFNYISENNKIPTTDDMVNKYGNTVRYLAREIYGSWNNAFIELNIPLNSVGKHNDIFLESEFHRFVQIHNRIPKVHEFNNSEYPSFWCYQNRFGSWNKAIVFYGYEPNDSNRKYELDDGEICASSYEFDISTWLKLKGIQYERNIPYQKISPIYKGKMDCDYKILFNNEIWYVEMAGFLNGTTFEKWSKEEKNYYFKLKYKKKLLRREEVNYLIIYSKDIKQKSLSDIFYFIRGEESFGE